MANTRNGSTALHRPSFRRSPPFLAHDSRFDLACRKLGDAGSTASITFARYALALGATIGVARRSAPARKADRAKGTVSY